MASCRVARGSLPLALLAADARSQETERLMSDSPPGITAGPHEDNLRYFDVSIAGPGASPYEGESAPSAERSEAVRKRGYEEAGLRRCTSTMSRPVHSIVMIRQRSRSDLTTRDQRLLPPPLPSFLPHPKH